MNNAGFYVMYDHRYVLDLLISIESTCGEILGDPNVISSLTELKFMYARTPWFPQDLKQANQMRITQLEN